MLCHSATYFAISM